MGHTKGILQVRAGRFVRIARGPVTLRPHAGISIPSKSGRKAKAKGTKDAGLLESTKKKMQKFWAIWSFLP